MRFSATRRSGVHLIGFVSHPDICLDHGASRRCIESPVKGIGFVSQRLRLVAGVRLRAPAELGPTWYTRTYTTHEALLNWVCITAVSYFGDGLGKLLGHSKGMALIDIQTYVWTIALRGVASDFLIRTWAVPPRVLHTNGGGGGITSEGVGILWGEILN